jgi:hypothetical protein
VTEGHLHEGLPSLHGKRLLHLLLQLCLRQVHLSTEGGTG